MRALHTRAHGHSDRTPPNTANTVNTANTANTAKHSEQSEHGEHSEVSGPRRDRHRVAIRGDPAETSASILGPRGILVSIKACPAQQWPTGYALRKPVTDGSPGSDVVGDTIDSLIADGARARRPTRAPRDIDRRCVSTADAPQAPTRAQQVTHLLLDNREFRDLPPRAWNHLVTNGLDCGRSLARCTSEPLSSRSTAPHVA